jgi:hypothetical protein
VTSEQEKAWRHWAADDLAVRGHLCGVAWTLLFVGLAIAAGAGLWWIVTWVEEMRALPNVVQPARQYGARDASRSPARIAR